MKFLEAEDWYDPLHLMTVGRGLAALTASLTLFSATAIAQSTQALISGRLTHLQSGAAVAGGMVTCWNASTGAQASAATDVNGNYYLPLLSPGLYRVRAESNLFQPREVQELDLPVAGRLELNFTLRPLNDVWEAGQYRSVLLPGSKTIVTFYGPDVDTSRSSSFEATKGTRGALEATLSSVIDPAQIRDLPLAGRDAYTMIVTQPNVTADAATARGLGISVMGNRPTASNFLLDGLENNNYLVTGNLSTIAPEAIQEYRVSTNNFSAEYGRSIGFVANAVTRSGGNQFHGIGYFYLKNDALNANGFQENFLGVRRTPAKERQFGFQVGGPILRNRLFFSTAAEKLRSRAKPLAEYFLPTPRYADAFAAVPGRKIVDLLRRFAPPPAAGRDLVQTADLETLVSVDRILSIHRGDWHSRSGSDRVFGRASINAVDRPDFVWSPYKDFIVPLAQDTSAFAGAWTKAIRPGLMNEARVGWSRDKLGWDRPHPEIPVLRTLFDGFTLPGAPIFYDYRNDSRSWEFVENLIWTRGNHMVTAGGGLLLRSIDSYQGIMRDGVYTFTDFFFAGFDSPEFFQGAYARTAFPAIRQPDYNREYGYRQYNFFVQDTFRASRRLVFNAGLRYENFGAPTNTGAVKDALLRPGPGNDWDSRLLSATFDDSTSGDQQLYRADGNNFAGRFGFSYDLTGKGQTLFRGAYGIFFDRPFDNLWQNARINSILIPAIPLDPGFDYLQPATSALQAAARGTTNLESGDFPDAVLFDGNLRDGYAQTYFYGIQHRATENLTVDISGTGSLGRKLIVTDILNRYRRARGGFISHRSSQGLSNYQGLSAVARYRGTKFNLQASYTLSHSIDHQSDALAGDTFDLQSTRIGDGGSRGVDAALTLQGDIRADRGNSDFDQRHNLVFYSIWDIPSIAQGTPLNILFRNWKVSQLAAFRSGFPYSVFGASGNLEGGNLATFNNRMNLNAASAEVSRPSAGGKVLLNTAVLSDPVPYLLGNTGRNAFRGPGLFNIDFSVGRSFGLRWLGESGRLTVRADAFNVLNHANLNSPINFSDSPNLGFAPFGRQGKASGFPSVSSFSETGRQIQMILRVEF